MQALHTHSSCIFIFFYKMLRGKAKKPSYSETCQKVCLLRKALHDIPRTHCRMHRTQGHNRQERAAIKGSRYCRRYPGRASPVFTP